MKLSHFSEIDSADHIDVMHEERRWAARVLKKKPGGLFQSATGIQQHVFARHFNSKAEMVMGLQIVDNHVREVVRIDNHLANAKLTQARECDFEQRAAAELHQRLGTIVGERSQSAAQASGQDHRSHVSPFSS
jgi:hypothetical protein